MSSSVPEGPNGNKCKSQDLPLLDSQNTQPSPHHQVFFCGQGSGTGNDESGVFTDTQSMTTTADNSYIDGTPSLDFLYSQLEAKERDLILAAELGKGLLDKNEDLSKQNERMAEEYSKKLENLEQEKYQLRRKLSTTEDECEQRVLDMQQDYQKLQSRIESMVNDRKDSDRERNAFITNLNEQNQRLTRQLRQTTENEEKLTKELRDMKCQYEVKRTSMNEHTSHLHILTEEVELLSNRKEDLEQKIAMLKEEREDLSSTLDQSASRIIQLERESLEQDTLIRSNEKVVECLTDTNRSLQDQLENIVRESKTSTTVINGDNRLSVGKSRLSSISGKYRRSVGPSILSEVSSSTGLRLAAAGTVRAKKKQIDVVLDTDTAESGSDDMGYECDIEEDPSSWNNCGRSSFSTSTDFRWNEGEFIHQLKEEVLTCYNQIRMLTSQLKRREKLLTSTNTNNNTVNNSSKNNPTKVTQQTLDSKSDQQDIASKEGSSLLEVVPEISDTAIDCSRDQEKQKTKEINNNESSIVNNNECSISDVMSIPSSATSSVDTSSSDDFSLYENNIDSLKTGSLMTSVEELKNRVQNLLRSEAKGQCVSCGFDSSEKLRLEVQLHKCNESKEKCERSLKSCEERLRRCEEAKLNTEGQLTILETKLKSVEERLEISQSDLKDQDISKDELMRKAWEVRDAAVERKNETQIELAMSRNEIKQTNSQLMEAIQQKVELSKQLDEWQNDMEDLLEEQMVQKLKTQSVKDTLSQNNRKLSAYNRYLGYLFNNSSPTDSNTTESRKTKLLSFFQRS